MASRRPHKKMKMVGRRVLAYCMAVLPLPFWIPAFAGMTRWAAGARQSLGFCGGCVSRKSSI